VTVDNSMCHSLLCNYLKRNTLSTGHVYLRYLSTFNRKIYVLGISVYNGVTTYFLNLWCFSWENLPVWHYEWGI